MKPLLWLLDLAAVCLIIWCVSDYSTVNHETLRITGKESVNTGSGHEYRVYTTGDTYKVSDSVVLGRFDSSRLYGHLQAGRTYQCDTIGWRVPFFSMFRNIKSCAGV